MKYDEIASKLGISVNTVKTQMKIALSRLREILKDYLIILLLFMGFKYIFFPLHPVVIFSCLYN